MGAWLVARSRTWLSLVGRPNYHRAMSSPAGEHSLPVPRYTQVPHPTTKNNKKRGCSPCRWHITCRQPFHGFPSKKVADPVSGPGNSEREAYMARHRRLCLFGIALSIFAPSSSYAAPEVLAHARVQNPSPQSLSTGVSVRIGSF
jgi:hypothetical protein